MRHIGIYVQPFYESGRTPGERPRVAVGAQFNDLLSSNKREDILAARDRILAAPGLVAAWLLVVTVALRELSSSLLLYSPGNEVLSVRLWLLYQGGELPQLAALGVALVVGLTLLTVLAFACWRRLGVATRPS